MHEGASTKAEAERRLSSSQIADLSTTLYVCYSLARDLSIIPGNFPYTVTRDLNANHFQRVLAAAPPPVYAARLLVS